MIADAALMRQLLYILSFVDCPWVVSSLNLPNIQRTPKQTTRSLQRKRHLDKLQELYHRLKQQYSRVQLRNYTCTLHNTLLSPISLILKNRLCMYSVGVLLSPMTSAREDDYKYGAL